MLTPRSHCGVSHTFGIRQGATKSLRDVRLAGGPLKHGATSSRRRCHVDSIQNDPIPVHTALRPATPWTRMESRLRIMNPDPNILKHDNELAHLMLKTHVPV